jgi:Na+-translocating ferredoxin:NAD+ oxidoreductase subunit C
MLGPRPAFSGGIALPRREPRPGELAIRQMPFAPRLYLPLRQHAGSPAVPVVREGDEVVRGQLLAEAGVASGVPLHAPATGRVLGIVEQPDAAGGTVPVIQLAPIPGDTQEYPGGPGCDPETASAASVLAAIRAAGIVGLGGEARSTHARLCLSPGQPVGVLVLNGIETEHVFSRVPAILRVHATDILMGVRCLLKASGAGRAVLAVEPQDADSAQSLLDAAPAGLPLTRRVLSARYPQGAEELLVRAIARAPGRGDGQPVGDGVLCFSVATVAELGRLLANGRCMTDQVVTLVGGALLDPGNYRVPLGTPLRFALEHAGLRPDPARVLEGGPMRGEALASLDRPIIKGATGFVALGGHEADTPESPVPCIRCGECVAVCPLQLHPAQLGLLARKGEFEVMQREYHLDRCIECGCCAYVCPSHIPLVQVFRAAKAQWRRLRPAVAGEDGV